MIDTPKLQKFHQQTTLKNVLKKKVEKVIGVRKNESYSKDIHANLKKTVKCHTEQKFQPFAKSVINHFDEKRLLPTSSRSQSNANSKFVSFSKLCAIHQ